MSNKGPNGRGRGSGAGPSSGVNLGSKTRTRSSAVTSNEDQTNANALNFEDAPENPPTAQGSGGAASDNLMGNNSPQDNSNELNEPRSPRDRSRPVSPGIATTITGNDLPALTPSISMAEPAETAEERSGARNRADHSTRGLPTMNIAAFTKGKGRPLSHIPEEYDNDELLIESELLQEEQSLQREQRMRPREGDRYDQMGISALRSSRSQTGSARHPAGVLDEQKLVKVIRKINERIDHMDVMACQNSTTLGQVWNQMKEISISTTALFDKADELRDELEIALEGWDLELEPRERPARASRSVPSGAEAEEALGELRGRSRRNASGIRESPIRRSNQRRVDESDIDRNPRREEQLRMDAADEETDSEEEQRVRKKRRGSAFLSYDKAPLSIIQERAKGILKNVGYERMASAKDNDRYNDDYVEGLIKRSFITPENFALHKSDIPISKMGVKVELPAPYAGSKDIVAFESWLSKLIHWLKLQKLNVLSSEQEDLRMDILYIALTDKALSWYRMRSDSATMDGVAYGFKEAIIDLKNRFVAKNAAVTAREKFETLKQESKEILTYYEELNDLVLHLTVKPDKYTFRNRLLQGMRSDLRTKIIGNGINAENNTVDEIVGQAVFFEDAEAYEKRVSSSFNRKDPPKRINENTPRMSSSQGNKPTNFTSLRRDPDKRTVSFSTNTLKLKLRPRSRSRSPPRRRMIDSSKTSSNKRDDQKSSILPAIKKEDESPKKGPECWSCGQAGHYSSECPNKDKKVRHVRAEYESDADEVIDHDPYERENEVEQEYDTDGYYAEDDPQNDDSESDEDKYLRTSAIRILRSAAMRVERESYARKAFTRKEKVKPESVETNVVKRKSSADQEQPTRNEASQRCIELMMEVNGLQAKTLIDPGSNTDMVSPDFARVARLETIELKEPIALQLALTGSRSKVNYGVRAQIKLGPITETRYMDVSNIDGYDIILGTPFCWENGCSPIFEEDGYLLIKGIRFDYSKVLKAAVPKRRPRRVSKGAAPKSGAEAEAPTRDFRLPPNLRDRR